ncbi:MAG: hypothetical protein IJP66_08910, partial [Kiritimatiellae bacterium]|nr:hypothetical protein [Kiritimatiellia bacterium]
MEPTWQKTGGYRALVNPQIDSEALRQSLASIESLASAPDATLLQAGRHRTVRLALDCGGGRRIDAVAKFFGRQSPLKDIADRVIGTKAHRTYDAARFLASQGIGTTPPIACLERWRGPRLTSCVFVSAFVAGATCFKDRLVELWRSRAPYSEFRDAIGAAARGVRALHDAGCTHGDLGNQNIFFSPDPDGGPCGDALFMDLNRARFDDVPLPMARRARDLARICLPEGFMDVFMRLYWGEEPPRAFMREWRLHHRLFRIHSATRKYRHPIRELDYALNPQKAPAQASYPPRRLQWVWDDKAMRPAPVAHDATLLSYLEPRYRSRLLRNSRAL